MPDLGSLLRDTTICDCIITHWFDNNSRIRLLFPECNMGLIVTCSHSTYHPLQYTIHLDRGRIGLSCSGSIRCDSDNRNWLCTSQNWTSINKGQRVFDWIIYGCVFCQYARGGYRDIFVPCGIFRQYGGPIGSIDNHCCCIITYGGLSYCAAVGARETVLAAPLAKTLGKRNLTQRCPVAKTWILSYLCPCKLSIADV